jgi:hypothetical protein
MRPTNRLGAIPLTMDRDICAKLVSLDKRDGKKEGGQTRTFLQYVSMHLLSPPVLLLEINKPVTIGRNPTLW